MNVQSAVSPCGLERALRMIADNERRAAGAQQVVHLGDEPARVPELERVPSLRQLGECRAKALVVTMEGRR